MNSFNSVDLYFLGRLYRNFEAQLVAPVLRSERSPSAAMRGVGEALRTTMTELYSIAGEFPEVERDAVASANLEGLLIFTKLVIENLAAPTLLKGEGNADAARESFEESYGLFSHQFVEEFIEELEVAIEAPQEERDRRLIFAYELFTKVVPSLLYREDPELDPTRALALEPSTMEEILSLLEQALQHASQSPSSAALSNTPACVLSDFAARLCIGRRFGLQRGEITH